MINRCLLVLTILPLLSACTVLKYEDVSNNPEYANLIGQRFTTKIEMIAHGITMGQNYTKVLSHISISPYPGFSGPEVLFREKLPAGSEFVTVKVLRSEWTVFGRQIECVFKPINFSFPENAKVWASCNND